MNKVTARSVARFLRAHSEEIVTAWLGRVSDRVTVDPRFLFPSEDLLDHVPVLLEGMGRALEGEEPITVDTPVVLKARELGKLRFEQGFGAHQILWEYQLLGSVIMARIDEAGLYAQGREAQKVMRRLFDAISAVQRSTMEEFLDHYEATINEREERLRGFNRALTHELRDEVGSILGAARMLREDFVGDVPEQRDRFVSIVVDNAERIEQLVQNLVELSRVEQDARQQRNVLLTHAAEEVARHLRSFAAANGVTVRIAEDLPPMEVNAAAVELALTNLLANSIKYHDPSVTERWVRVTGEQAPDGWITVEVVDNGRGVPEEEQPRLFERFFRASSARDVPGTGLGLNLVKSVIESVGGTVWAEFSDGTTAIGFRLPARRQDDGVHP